MTVKELTARSVDILQAPDVCQVVFDNERIWESFKNLQAAMTIIYDHYRSEKKASYPVLCIEQSLELLHVRKIIPWETELMPDRCNPSENVLTLRISKDISSAKYLTVVCCADRVVLGLDASHPYCRYEILRGEIGPITLDTNQRLRWYYDQTGLYCRETMT